MISNVLAFSTEILYNEYAEYTMNLDNLPANAKFFLDVLIAGDGTAKGDYFIFDDTDTPYTPSGNSQIFAGHTKVTGVSGRERYALDNPMIIGKKMRMRITETAAVIDDNLTPTIYLVIWGGREL